MEESKRQYEEDMKRKEFLKEAGIQEELLDVEE
jgi:hypothetical protein